MFRKLDDSVSVAGQITSEDVAEAARQGFAVIVNNRPDDEDAGQPEGAAIAAAAAAAGLSYRAIPVTHAGFSDHQVAQMQDVLSAAQGPVLAFCRSGTRSTLLWALARARMGDEADALQAKAQGAGYDLTPIRAFL